MTLLPASHHLFYTRGQCITPCSVPGTPSYVFLHPKYRPGRLQCDGHRMRKVKLTKFAKPMMISGWSKKEHQATARTAFACCQSPPHILPRQLLHCYASSALPGTRYLCRYSDLPSSAEWLAENPRLQPGVQRRRRSHGRATDAGTGWPGTAAVSSTLFQMSFLQAHCFAR